MTAPEAFNFHSRYISEYINAILSGLPNEDAQLAINLIEETDLAGYPHAVTIWHAIRDTITENLGKGRGRLPLNPLEVHELLKESNQLEDEAMRHAWNYFVTSTGPSVPVHLAYIPDLADRVIQSNLRIQLSAITNRTDCHTAPLADLVAALDRDVARIHSIMRRLERDNNLKSIEGDAA